MGPRLFLILCFVALAAGSLLAVGTGIWMIETHLPDGVGRDLRDIVIVYGGAVAFLLVAVIAILWAYLDHAVAQPLAALVRGIQTALHAGSDRRMDVDGHRLGALPGCVDEMIRQLALTRAGVGEAVDRATVKLSQQNNQLATVLRDLHEGVVVCTLAHRILLYNSRALELLRIGGDIGLDRSLLQVMAGGPIEHALTRLHRRRQPAVDAGGDSIAFVGSTIDGRHTLHGRISLVVDDDSRATGYVLSFEDGTRVLAALGLRDRLLREATEGLRAPVANLRAAAEILVGSPPLAPGERRQFEAVVLQEARFLTDRLESLAAYYREVVTGHWPTSDVWSPDLLQTLADRLREHRIEATLTGIPHWVHGDSYSLLELLERSVVRVCGGVGATRVDLEATAGERWVYVDVVWSGPVAPASALRDWLDAPLSDVLGGLSPREILERHRTDLWCMPGAAGQARLRLPLPHGHRPTATFEPPPIAARPEFYDFELLQRPTDTGDLGPRRLKSLGYVVFDTETTGLEPSRGDEIVAIAGVRIVNGRILTGESFQRLVNPRRPIPAASARVHGITDAMVADKPPIAVVLPQFRAFVGDAVLVAHNAAFDLKFLERGETESGIRFDMPALDTLLLSCFVHDHTPRHTLDAMAERFGIPIDGRHTAIGDSLVTAACFLKMLDVLEANGVATLDDALAVSRRMVEAGARQQRF